MNIDSLLSSAKQPEATVRLCLRGDLQSEWEKLDRQLSDNLAAAATLAPSAENEDLANCIKALESAMAESTVEVRFRALSRKPWLKLISDNAPRPSNPADQAMGFNTETLFEALIRESIVSPELDDEQFEKLLDAVTSKQFDNLADAAWNLNRKDTDAAVFSRAASQVIPDSGEKSQRPSDSESPRRASRAKNPKS